VTTRHDLHHLVDELPENTLVAAEAFLAFLRDRVAPGRPPPKRRSPGRLEGQGWAAGERRGLKQRRQAREKVAKNPDHDDLA
jgi:hypothetical protein